MAADCCSKKCFFTAVAYFVACNNILSGVFSVAKLNTGAVSAGLVFVILGILLLVGLIEKREKLVLAFVISEAILLALVTVGLIVVLVNSDLHFSDDEYVFIKIYSMTLIILWILLVIVYLCYREMLLSGPPRLRLDSTPCDISHYQIRELPEIRLV